MDLLVVEGESVVGGQAPVAAAQEKNVCGTCGKKFARGRNLRDHEETQHTDQTTPEAVAKRLKLKEYRNTRWRERYANDPVYREKRLQASQTNLAKKKARAEAAEDGEHKA